MYSFHKQFLVNPPEFAVTWQFSLANLNNQNAALVAQIFRQTRQEPHLEKVYEIEFQLNSNPPKNFTVRATRPKPAMRFEKGIIKINSGTSRHKRKRKIKLGAVNNNNGPR